MGILWQRRRQWLGAVAPLAIFALGLTIFAWVMSYAKPGGADLFGNGSRAFVSVFFSKGVVGIGRSPGTLDEFYPHVINQAKSVQPTILSDMGFGARSFSSVATRTDGWAACAPIPIFVFAMAVLPTMWLLDLRRRRIEQARLRASQCPQCGYDLCSHYMRCPECGWEFVRVGWGSFIGATRPQAEPDTHAAGSLAGNESKKTQ